MRILIDADACPSIREVEVLARQYAVEMILYFDTSHDIQSSYAKTVLCDTDKDSTDMRLLRDVIEGDIIITQDYGLASLVLPKGAFVIHPKGFWYTENNIDSLLLTRALNAKAKRKKGPKKRTKEDTIKLLTYIEDYLNKGEMSI